MPGVNRGILCEKGLGKKNIVHRLEQGDIVYRVEQGNTVHRLGQDKIVHRLGQIGRASCRERV